MDLFPEFYKIPLQLDRERPLASVSGPLDSITTGLPTGAAARPSAPSTRSVGVGVGGSGPGKGVGG